MDGNNRFQSRLCIATKNDLLVMVMLKMAKNGCHDDHSSQSLRFGHLDYREFCVTKPQTTPEKSEAAYREKRS